jgi:hypothetical protein
MLNNHMYIMVLHQEARVSRSIKENMDMDDKLQVKRQYLFLSAKSITAILTCFTGSQYLYHERPVHHYSHSVMTVVLKIMQQGEVGMVNTELLTQCYMWCVKIDDSVSHASQCHVEHT